MRPSPILTRLGVACAFCLVLLRRTDQLTAPQVWDEEGTKILPSLLEHGYRALFTPVNGYLITISRVLSYTALKLGGLQHYPAVSTALGLAVTAAALLWLATAPLFVRGGALLAIAVALVPSDVEVFVVPQYVFWFAGLTLFTLVLWQPGDDSRAAGRIAVALVGGFSNPIVVLLAPISAARALLLRTRTETAVAISMAVTALTQLWLVHTIPGTSAVPGLVDAAITFSRMLGYPFLLGFRLFPGDDAMYVVAAVHAVAIAAFLLPPEARGRRLAIVALFLLAAASSILRCQPPTMMHPVAAGPRYFFFPDVFLSWFWIDAVLTSARPAAARLVPAAAIALILFSTSHHFNRHHDRLDWQTPALELARKGRATFPVHYDGIAAHAWSVTMAACGDSYCKQ